MSANFTIYRALSGYSADELNSLFNTFVTQFAPTLPNVVRTQCGNEFDNISISDNDPLSAGVCDIDSLYRAIAYLGENLAPIDCADGDGSPNSTWNMGIVSGGNNLNGLTMTVRDRVNDDDDDDGYAIVASTNYINPYAFSANSANGIGTPRAIQLETVAINDRISANTYTYYTYIQSTGKRIPCSNTTTNTGNFAGFLSNQSIADRRFAGTLGLQVPTIYSSIQITPYSFSSGATITLSGATAQIVDGGLSDNQSYPITTIERFDGIGVNEWVQSANTTLNIESFAQDFDINSWNVETPRNLTIETFSIGFPQGTQPTISCCGSSTSAENTEILTAQIDGVTQTFTLTTPYISGSLKVYWNGQRQTTGDTITEDNDLQFTTTFLATIGTELIADYFPKI